MLRRALHGGERRLDRRRSPRVSPNLADGAWPTGRRGEGPLLWKHWERRWAPTQRRAAGVPNKFRRRSSSRHLHELVGRVKAFCGELPRSRMHTSIPQGLAGRSSGERVSYSKTAPGRNTGVKLGIPTGDGRDGTRGVGGTPSRPARDADLLARRCRCTRASRSRNEKARRDHRHQVIVTGMPPRVVDAADGTGRRDHHRDDSGDRRRGVGRGTRSNGSSLRCRDRQDDLLLDPSSHARPCKDPPQHMTGCSRRSTGAR